MKNIFYAAVVILIVNGVDIGSPKGLVLAQDNRIIALRPAVNEGGWKIPGLEQSRITDPRKLLPRTYGPASLPLNVTVLKPTQEFITTIPLYRLKDGQILIIAERKVVINSIIKCDVNNHVFVYILQCTIILEESTGRTGYSGTFGVHYYDRDGDGKFESFEEGKPFVTPDLSIPDWVLKNP